MTLQIAGNTLMLLPEKVIFLPDADTLLVAHAHIGKASTFRQLGVPQCRPAPPARRSRC